MRAARAVRASFDQRHRYEHVVRVARLAERLAATHGVDTLRARLAGLLHDLARLYPAERLLRECSERGLPIGPFERSNPIVLHARLGAELARERFGVDDPGVLSAIRKHTVADGVMTPLDAVVYLADGLEPGRSFSERPVRITNASATMVRPARSSTAMSSAFLSSAASRTSAIRSISGRASLLGRCVDAVPPCGSERFGRDR